MTHVYIVIISGFRVVAFDSEEKAKVFVGKLTGWSSMLRVRIR